jgi:threonine 3-dehydrogenase
VNTKILGVDIDGGFRTYAVIPAENARPTDRSVPKEIACFQDALGNAVHTVMAGPVKGQTVLITGMGPIGLFAVSICKALGAAKVIVTEISDYRIDLAHKVGADVVLSPKDGDLCSVVSMRRWRCRATRRVWSWRFAVLAPAVG